MWAFFPSNLSLVAGDAKVTLTNTQTGVSVERTSDSNGSFEFITVRIGTYVLTAEKAVIHTAGVQAKAILLAMQTEGCEDLGPGEWGHDLRWTEADTINGLAALVALLYGARTAVDDLRAAGAFPTDQVDDGDESEGGAES